jgi:hypothetical protein
MSCGSVSRIAVFQRHATTALPLGKRALFALNSRPGDSQNLCALCRSNQIFCP